MKFNAAFLAAGLMFYGSNAESTAVSTSGSFGDGEVDADMRRSSNGYCTVQGFPGKFQVGCASIVSGKWNCDESDTMYLWCPSSGKWRYCCGDACDGMNVPNKCNLKSCSYGQNKNYYNQGLKQGASTLRLAFNSVGKNCNKLRSLYNTVSNNAPSSPYCLNSGWKKGASNAYNSLQSGCRKPSCTWGQNKNWYNQGVKQGDAALRKSFNNVGQNCNKLDSVYNTVSNNAPSSPYCLNSGWKKGANNAYTKLQSNCISNCFGVGKSVGKSLGMTFCQVNMLAAQSSGITKAICNAVEQTSCETTFENYVDNNCPGSKASNMSFYNQLFANCAIH